MDDFFEVSPLKKNGNIKILSAIWKLIRGKHYPGNQKNLEETLAKTVAHAEFEAYKTDKIKAIYVGRFLYGRTLVRQSKNAVLRKFLEVAHPRYLGKLLSDGVRVNSNKIKATTVAWNNTFLHIPDFSIFDKTNHLMPLAIVIAGIILLFILIAHFKLNAFIAFIIVALLVGVAEGMDFLTAIKSIQNGIGNTLGYLILILGLGAMLGKLVADSGAAQRITMQLVQKFGKKNIQWAVVLTGFIVGIPMFYTVGFVILVPLVFTVAAATGLNLIYVGLPMLASLSVTHGYLPPHPAPTGIAIMFDADIGKTLLYGIIIAIPAIIVAGPLFSRTIKNVNATPLKEFMNPKVLTDEEMPGTLNSILTALLPVILIGLASIVALVLPEENILRKTTDVLGDPVVAMLISVLVAIYTLGLARGKKMKEVMDSVASAVSGITMVLLIIAGAGALKEVLIDSGVSEYIGDMLKGSTISPLVLAWLIATVIRVCVGSATVAGLTAAGIALPLIQGAGVNAELMVLAIGSGSLMLSHVNDGGFWLYKEYFNLSIKDTLRTWTVMETTVGVMGLVGVLVLEQFVG